MKKCLIYLMIVLINYCCKKDDIQQDYNKKNFKTKKEIEDSTSISHLPIGDEKIKDFDFPEIWDNLQELDDTNPHFTINKISKTGYDSMFYFIEKNANQYYNSLILDKTNHTIKLPYKETNGLLKLYDNSVVLDSAYYISTLSNKPNFTLKLYKNGNKYKSFLVGENNKKSFDYLSLITFDKFKNPIDFKIIYYNNYDDIQSYKRFFYLDNANNIYIKDFIVDELSTQNSKYNSYKISNNGTFQKN